MAIVKHSSNPAQPSIPWLRPTGELGKTEARQSFLRLLNDLQDNINSLAITDHGKKVAILMGYKQYEILVSMIKQHSKSADKNPFAGLISYTGNLEKSKKKVNKLFEESLKRSRDNF